MLRPYNRINRMLFRTQLRPIRSSSFLPMESALDRWKSISFIASSIAIPIVLAIVGYFIQKQLAEEGLKKDYVSIAASILKENPINQEPELRKWAVTMLDSNSPISFSNKAKVGLEKGSIYIALPPPKIPSPPDDCMKEPKQAMVYPAARKLFKKQYESMEAMEKGFKDFLILSLTAEKEAMEDRASLTCLQQYSRIIGRGREEVTENYTKPVDKLSVKKTQ